MAAFSTAKAEEARPTLSGYEEFALDLPHRARPVAAALWYPAANATYRGQVNTSPIFKPVSVYMGPRIAQGRHPLFIFSHGSGGNMGAMAWLADGLVQSGAMVLAVNHRGSTSGDSSPRRSLQLDDRLADLQGALDFAINEPLFAQAIDPENIHIVGFSLGGATALNAAGIQFDREAFGDYCQARPEAVDCRFFAKGNVDFANLPEGFSVATRLESLKSVIAIDPGFTYAATGDSIESAQIPALFISLGEDGLFEAADIRIEGSDLAQKWPDAVHETLAPASHFTFLPVCMANADVMLAEEGEDPICTDPPLTDRTSIHAQILQKNTRLHQYRVTSTENSLAIFAAHGMRRRI